MLQKIVESYLFLRKKKKKSKPNQTKNQHTWILSNVSLCTTSAPICVFSLEKKCISKCKPIFIAP